MAGVVWINAVFLLPWPSSIWPEPLSLAVPVAVTGGCGAMVGMVLTGQRLPRRAVSVGLVAPTVVAVGAAAANGLRYEVPQNATAPIALTEAPGSAGSVGDGRRPHQPDRLVGDDPNWVTMLGWQGGLDNERGIFNDHLERVGPGHYRSTGPMPVSGSWKTLCAYTTAAS